MCTFINTYLFLQETWWVRGQFTWWFGRWCRHQQRQSWCNFNVGHESSLKKEVGIEQKSQYGGFRTVEWDENCSSFIRYRRICSNYYSLTNNIILIESKIVLVSLKAFFVARRWMTQFFKRKNYLEFKFFFPQPKLSIRFIVHLILYRYSKYFNQLKVLLEIIPLGFF